MEASLPDPTGALGGSPYADPREVEHPLTPIASLKANRLAWVQPRLMHPAYELWGNESVVATLRFRDLQRREALAASANGIWMVSASEREEGAVHFDSPGGSIAEYRLAPQGAGSLLLRGSRPLVWLRKSLWTSLFAFVDIAGNEFMRFEVAADRSGKTIVILSDAAVTDPDAALVAVAGHYLTLGTTPTKGAGPSANYRT